jgi:hypothetical protein
MAQTHVTDMDEAQRTQGRIRSEHSGVNKWSLEKKKPRVDERIQTLSEGWEGSIVRTIERWFGE